MRAPVALDVALAGGGRGAGYPVSLPGTMAFVRQGFLDAAALVNSTIELPPTGAAIEATHVAFTADSQQVRLDRRCFAI